MSHAKWDLLIWRLEDGGAGAGQWAPGGGAGKKKGWRSRARGSRECISVPLLLSNPSWLLPRAGGAWSPRPIPSFPGILPSFPSRAGLGTAFPIVSLGLPCRVGRGSWHLLLGPYKWWLVEEAPEGGSREQGAGVLENGPGQAPAAHIQPQGLWLPGLLPASVASVSASFVFLASCALPRPRFPGLEKDQWAAHVFGGRAPTLGSQ